MKKIYLAGIFSVITFFLNNSLLTILSFVIIALLMIILLFKNTNNIGKGAIFVVSIPFILSNENSVELFSVYFVVLFLLDVLNINFIRPVVVKKNGKTLFQYIIFILMTFLANVSHFYLSAALILEYQHKDVVLQELSGEPESVDEEDYKNVYSGNNEGNEDKKSEIGEEKLTVLYYLFSAILILNGLILMLKLPKKRFYELLFMNIGLIGLGILYVFLNTNLNNSLFAMLMVSIPFSFIGFYLYIKYKDEQCQKDRAVPEIEVVFNDKVKKTLLEILRIYLSLNFITLTVYYVCYGNIPYFQHDMSRYIVYPLMILLILSALAFISFKLHKNYRTFVLIPVSVLDFFVFYLTNYTIGLFLEKHMTDINRTFRYDMDIVNME